MRETIGGKLAKSGGVGEGFDFLRIGLATSVVAWHSFYAVHGNGPGAPNLDATWFVWFPGYAILAMFFALSGFLISGSAQRLNLKNFMINRGMRIIPALAVEIVLSAFILGPIFTNLPLGRYFSSPLTWHYFTNIFGWVNFYLPGVFVSTPAHEVNNSLWTVPYEFGCYAFMAALIGWKLLKRPPVVILITAALVGFGLLVQFSHIADHRMQVAQLHSASQLALKIVNFYVLDRGSRLFPSFLLGIAIYLYRDRVPYDWRLFGACIVLCIVIALLGPAPWMEAPLLNATLCPVLVYMTAFLGVTRIPIHDLLKRGDYSYGIYLYGFPVQQTVMALLPGLKSPLINFGLSMIFVTAFAAFSWHLIEKPLLKLRKKFSFMAKERLEPVEQTPSAALKAQDAKA